MADIWPVGQFIEEIFPEENMFSKQKGCFTILTYLVGFCLIVFGIVLLPYGLHSVFPDGFPKLLEFGSLYKLVILLFSLFVIILFGTIIMGLFPSIRVMQTGIKVKRLLGVKKFNWNEVEEIVKLSRPKEAKGIILSPQGPLLLKFIKNYPYYLYGVIAGVLDPVVILSSGLENRDEIVTEVAAHINERGK